MVTTCQYLFGKEAEQIFTCLRLPHGVNKSAIVDQCLELTMRVHLVLLERGGLHYIDPMAFHDQCHLYALRAAQIGRKKGDKTERNDENRFLHLTLFLSKHFSNSKKRVETFVEIAGGMIETFPFSEKKFKSFLLDEGACLERASRESLNALFESHLKRTLSEMKVTPLHEELALIAKEDLQKETSRRGVKMYTYPKLAGVAFFVDTLAREKIPFVVKVKVLTHKGSGGTMIQANGEAEENDPVIVFEGIATDGTYTLPEVREKATNCPSFFFRKDKTHREEETCFYCQPTTLDLSLYHERLKKVLSSPQDMFYALGADFILQKQSGFKPYFEDFERYPLLSKIFSESIPKIKELGLEMNHPTTFSVCHVYATTAAVAFTERLLIDREVV